MILISVLYQNESTSRILEPSPLGLISKLDIQISKIDRKLLLIEDSQKFLGVNKYYLCFEARFHDFSD